LDSSEKVRLRRLEFTLYRVPGGIKRLKIKIEINAYV